MSGSAWGRSKRQRAHQQPIVMGEGEGDREGVEAETGAGAGGEANEAEKVCRG